MAPASTLGAATGARDESVRIAEEPLHCLESGRSRVGRRTGEVDQVAKSIGAARGARYPKTA